MAEELLIVQGQPASKPEYNVAVALGRLNIPFLFQYDVFGGRRLRGGYVIDFIIENPFEEVLEVFGEYWHPDELTDKDRLKLAYLTNLFGGKEPYIIWGSEADTVEMAVETLRAKVL